MGAPASATSPELESSMLARAARILYSFSGLDPELSLTDVVRRTGLPRSSVHRILDQLVQLRALERAGSRYRLGLGLIELGGLAAHQNRLREVCRPHLDALHESTGAMVHLAILDGHEIVYLERLGGASNGRIPSRLGGRQPAYCTGAGKALLAFSCEGTVAQVIAEGMPPRTANTITRPQLLRQELARVRDRGVAFDREENYRGIFCVAAPLRDTTGRPVAAISLSGAPGAMNTQRLIPPLLTTVRAVWQTLFSSPPRRRRAMSAHASVQAV
ncbi:IclR family transcriptional regulator [Microtetraspora niveoalba]|uniref:IclR family transcriptional regulator n=1 Tax=Microtetraspora niveoalba TaxID=46175 RepID=UPI00082E05DB|nr:IclR family transcriptional regulator [Microtetraspora niveoalba]